jgi:hypothetical protein
MGYMGNFVVGVALGEDVAEIFWHVLAPSKTMLTIPRRNFHNFHTIFVP